MKTPPRILLFFFLILLSLNSLSAQWVQTSGPCGGTISCFAVSGSNLFVGTNTGVYLSSDFGKRWTCASSGLTPDTLVTHLVARPNETGGADLFAGTLYGGVYRSTDDGTSWTAANSGILSWGMHTTITALAVIPNGKGGSNLFAGTSDGDVFLSTNSGDSWNECYGPGGNVKAFAYDFNWTGGINLFAGTLYGVFLSTNNGSTWTEANNGLKDPLGNPLDVDALLSVGTKLFAGTGQGVYLSTNNGSSWSSVDTNSTLGSVDALAVDGSNLFAGTGTGVFLSIDSGKNWTAANNGLTIAFISCFVVMPALGGTGGSNLLAGTSRGDVFLSTDDAGSWSAIKHGFMYESVYSILSYGSSLYAATEHGVFCSTDKGGEWVPANNRLMRESVHALAVSGTKIFAGAHLLGVLSSTDSGKAWNYLPQSILTGKNVQALCASGSNLFAGTDQSVFLSTDGGMHWTVAGHSLPKCDVRALAISDTRLFAGTDDAGVFLSTDNGASWTTVNNGLMNTNVRALAVSDTNLFVGTDGGGVFLSTDNGTTWSGMNNGLTAALSKHVEALCLYGSDLLAGTHGGVWLFDKTSRLWREYGQGYKREEDAYVVSLTIVGRDMYAGTASAGIWRRPVYEIIPDSYLDVTGAEQVIAGMPFWVEVSVGNKKPITDLSFISFRLSSGSPNITYVDNTAAVGAFLQDAVATFSRLDQQTVSITLQKRSGGGSSGDGVIARAQFTSPPTLSSEMYFSVGVSDIAARNSSGELLGIQRGGLSVRVVPTTQTGPQVWPGDCDNNGTVDAADLLPIGVYYGQRNGSPPTSNTPGNQWRAYARTYWENEPPGKAVYADADGNGTVGGTDVLPIGLNYGKRHQVVGGIGKSGAIASTVSKAGATGSVEIVSAKRKSLTGNLVRIPILLKATEPIYGIAFTLHSKQALRFTGVDTAGNVLSEALMITKSSDERGLLDIGFTKTQGNGYAGTGQLVDVKVELPRAEMSFLSFEILNVVANDPLGNRIDIAGGSYQARVTNVNDQSDIPETCGLNQNYPNPFNPVTNFEFRVSGFGYVSLKVFDVLGREVAVLVSDAYAPGVYTIQWDASAKPSGVYYYRMTARETSGKVFTQTRRMALVK